MITLNNISLTFSGNTIFDNLSFNIQEREHVCLSGPSGKGKSTLLKIMQGYILPDSGMVKICNTLLSADSIKEIREKIIWVPQNINLPVANGFELLKLMNITSNIEIVKNHLTKLGLDEEIVSKDFSLISGGQKQRIIIAICLSLNKKIILMDEPTASLDDESIKLLIELLKSLIGKTVVAATHNQTFINSMNRVIEL